MSLPESIPMLNIDDRLEAIKRYFAEQPIVFAAYLFGSYGTEYQTPQSDVDIAVLVDNETVNDIDKQLELECRISDILGTDDVDVLFLNQASLLMQYKVLRTGRLLYEREGDLLSDFIEYVLIRYLDYQIDYSAFCREYDKALPEVDSRGRGR
ncbi:type VII toxin-antitoxin system MntA family adenylyltransferase antitoxin [Heliophilum fasciatum]|uniref:Putative nucleotidyltransferase n=1 Tax=Heliophilum fasciatum TaxID=35700 RepID=A0A4R2RVU1_9FIRM|nr:nucleotidyltransferase domain-containing protein [Heliophilum fasciatum]MCW2278844.1 putative nucleotidyltransferase [Heliophilum fasciatum]TCP64071.1 putative nucleotidyltransferase [Heliophilum fasciatum]